VSLVGLMQEPPQSTSPLGQATAHAPLEQTLPDGHALPAVPASTTHPAVAPQWRGSFIGFTQEPPQSIWPVGQLTVQVPLAQELPEAHAVPAEPPSAPQPAVAPQCVGLVVGSTHEPPHGSWPVGQAMPHCPLAQTCPVPQALPQLPQFAGSTV
jgi:hypothetical protein